MAKLKFEGNVFAGLLEKLDKLGGDVDKAIEESLEASAEIVQKNVEAEMRKHKRTGNTERTIIKNQKVKKSGTVSSIRVGFDLPKGLTSIFLMYGTPRRKPEKGQLDPDKKLYNAIYGSKVKKEIREKQSEIISKAIRKRMED